MTKKLEIELDIYEREYVMKNQLDYIYYSDEYIDGFTKEIPEYTIQNKDYKNQCIIHVKKLLILYDRVKGLLQLKTSSNFYIEDRYKLFYKILYNLSFLSKFLQYHDKFKNIVIEKVKEFERESKHIKKELQFTNFECVKNRIHKIISV